jgi:type IV pilus assembly protein PilV
MKREGLGPWRGDAGFTLIELVVAILVFALGIMGILKMHEASVQVNNFSMQLTEAVNAADNVKEYLRALPFEHNSLTVGTHNTTQTLLRNIPYNVSYRVDTVEGTGGSARNVTISVTWLEKDTPHLFTLPFVVNEAE